MARCRTNYIVAVCILFSLVALAPVEARSAADEIRRVFGGDSSKVQNFEDSLQPDDRGQISFTDAFKMMDVAQEQYAENRLARRAEIKEMKRQAKKESEKMKAIAVGESFPVRFADGAERAGVIKSIDSHDGSVIVSMGGHMQQIPKAELERSLNKVTSLSDAELFQGLEFFTKARGSAKALERHYQSADAEQIENATINFKEAIKANLWFNVLKDEALKRGHMVQVGNLPVKRSAEKDRADKWAEALSKMLLPAEYQSIKANVITQKPKSRLRDRTNQHNRRETVFQESDFFKMLRGPGGREGDFFNSLLADSLLVT